MLDFLPLVLPMVLSSSTALPTAECVKRSTVRRGMATHDLEYVMGPGSVVIDPGPGDKPALRRSGADEASIRRMTMTAEENKELVLQAHERFLEGDVEGLERFLAPDCVLHQCGFLEPLRRSELRGFLGGGGRALSDRRRWVEAVVAEGDTVAIRWTTTGRHTGFLLREATGKQVTFGSMTFVRVRDGKIAEIWNIQDTATLRTQLEEPAEPVGRR
jgi:predicted ester cyclase